MLSMYMLSVLFLISWLSMALFTAQQHFLLAAMNLKQADTYLSTEGVVLSIMRCQLEDESTEDIHYSGSDVSFDASQTNYGYIVHVHSPIQEEILLQIDEKSREFLDYDTVRSASPASSSFIS